MIIPVILAGGAGTRLWPISSQELPKQFVALFGDNELTLFQKALIRLKDIPQIGAPIIICSHDYKEIVEAQLRAINITDASIILEPVGRNTAPAIAIAALVAKQIAPDPILLVTPSDHLITDIPKFHQAIATAAVYAKQGNLICFGIEPQYPETGYGYIKVGANLTSGDAYTIERFVEKPNFVLATQYVNSGQYLWNAGIFMFKADSFLYELEAYAKEIYSACRNTMQSSTYANQLLSLDKSEFSRCPSQSVDYAVMEHTRKAIVISMDANWSDVGSWLALWQCSNKDAAGNVLIGDIIAQDVEDSYVHASKRKVIALGVKDHIIVETDNEVLVLHKDYCQNVRNIAAIIQKERKL